MLGGQRQTLSPTETGYAPTTAQSFSAAFGQSSAEARQIFDYVIPGLSTEEERKRNAERLEGINRILEDPRQSTTQKGLNMVSGVAGSLLPTLPFTFVGGVVARGIAGAVGFGARKLALEAGSEPLLAAYAASQVPLNKLATSALSYYLPKQSIAELATGFAQEYGIYKGYIIPEHFAQHYNAVENTLDAKAAIKDWGADNYGFLLAGLPFAAGYVAFKGIRGSIARRAARLSEEEISAETKRLHEAHLETVTTNTKENRRVSELQDHLQQAEDEKRISPEMHQWYLNYIEHPNSTKTWEDGLKVLDQLQTPYDRVTGRIWHQILEPEGVEQLKNAVFDEALTRFEEPDKQLLSGFVIHNQLDKYIQFMKDHPTMLDGLKGMTDIIERQITEHRAALKAFDETIKTKLPQGLLKKQLFSQNNIYQHLKKLGVHSIRDIPYHVPKDVAYKLKLAHQIKEIKERRTPKMQRLYEQGKHLELKEKLDSIKLPTPKEELESLHTKLMPEGILVRDFKNKSAYHRLENLSQIWPQAKVLLDRIALEDFNARQKGFNGILKAFTQMVDNTASNLARADSVTKYLRERVEQAVPVVGEFERHGIRTAPIETKVIEEAGEDLLANEALKEQIQDMGFKEANTAFELSESKLKQFRENTHVLKELIDCVVGG